MDVLLVLNNGKRTDMKVMVQLHTQMLKRQVKYLVKQKKGREAFDLIVKEAMFNRYIPAGKKSKIKPELTLVEDLL